MNEDFRNDVLIMNEYILNAHKEALRLKAIAEGAPTGSASLQKTLETAAAQFEFSVLEMRRICERYSPGTGGYPKHLLSNVEHLTGTVELLEGRWPRITLNTLLPHCRYQTALWLTDTIRRLLNEYERGHGKLPCFPKAVMVIEEACDVGGRRIFDQDNKGWKAVGNAVKGRLVPDDDQFSLSIFMRASFSDENCCRITLAPEEETLALFQNCFQSQQI